MQRYENNGNWEISLWRRLFGEDFLMNGELICQFSRVVEVVAEHAEGIDAPAYRHMRAAAAGVVFRFGGGKAEVEEGAEHIGTVGDVVAGAFPLEHGLVQDATRIDEGVEMVVVVHQPVEAGGGEVVHLGGVVIEDVLILLSHVKH